MPKRKLSDEAIADIQERWVNGGSRFDIAIDYDVSVPAISKHTWYLTQVAQARRGRPRIYDYDRVCELLDKGISADVVAERVGVKKAYIHKIKCWRKKACTTTSHQP